MKNAIWHINCWLASGSLAHKLHTEGKWAELAAHMKELDNKDRALRK